MQRIIETLSRISFLNNPSLKQDVSLCSPIILQEFRYYVILRFKISRFVLCLWSPRCFQLCLINRLSKLSFIKFRGQLHFGFELAQHKRQPFCSLLRLRLMQKTFQFPFQFLFPFFPSRPVFQTYCQRFSSNLYHWITRKCVTKIEPISLESSRKVYVTNVFQVVIYGACDPCNVICFTYSQ